MAYRFIFKLSTWTLGLLLFISCAKITRDNILDPKNPDSQREQKVLIEAFVNTENPFEYNELMLTALDSLERRHPEKIEIVAYHRNTRDEVDPLHINESELQYMRYLEALGSNFKGLPDVFINGASQRVQGASSSESALLRLEEALVPELQKISKYTIEVETTVTNETITPTVTLARLGSNSSPSLVIKVLLIQTYSGQATHNVVRDISRSTVINRLSAGEQQTLILPNLNLNGIPANRLIIYITDVDEWEVFQCCTMEL